MLSIAYSCKKPAEFYYTIEQFFCQISNYVLDKKFLKH